MILSSVWHFRLFVLSVMMQSKTRHPLWMLLNDVREDGDRISPGEEASSLSQIGCLPAGIPMRVQVRRTGTRDELISDQKEGEGIQGLTSLGSREMKSLWNCGSITCIMCFTWLVSHLSINSSRANSLSGPLHV